MGLTNFCNVLSKRSNLIKLIYTDYTKKMAHSSKIVQAKENLELSELSPAKDRHQAPSNRLKLYVRTVIESEA